MESLMEIKIEDYLDVLTDYHSNGSYETLRNNVKLLREKSYAVMIRTLNFERNDFSDDLLYVDENAYNFLIGSAIQPNDILMNKIASPGSIYIMPDLHCKVTCGMNLFLIRFNDKVNQRYMYYNMKNSEDRIKKIAHGTSTKTITKDEVRNISLYIHDRFHQDKIENLLTSFDSKIENNNKINSELESLAKTIYDYWFLQFDFPNEEGKPYKSSGGAMEYNEELKMDIPKGWGVKRVTDITDWISNSQPPKKNFIYKPKDGYVRFIQNRDYDSDEYKTYIPMTKSLNMVNRYDILVDKYGDAGSTRYGIEGTYNVALAKIQPHDKNTQEYLRSFLSSKGIYTYLHNACMASTRASLDESVLSYVYVPIPPTNLLARFENTIHLFREQILVLQDENDELISLRDYLLPLLMNGQVGFKDE